MVHVWQQNVADGIESIFEARYQLRIYNRISICLIYIGQPSYLRVKEEEVEQDINLR